MDSITRIDVLGCPFDQVSLPETTELMRRAVAENTRLHIVTGNVDCVMKARRDPRLAAELRRADLLTADGVPILWAAGWLGTPLRGRVSGVDLVWQCAQLAAETGCGVALVGAGPGVALRAAETMRARFPRASIHVIPTPFRLDEQEGAALVEQIKAVQAKFVLAALGMPKQERWLSAHLRACGACVGIGCGGAFDIICGDRPRAPLWMCEHGLEWLHRLLLEPRRLGRRYLIEDSAFIVHVLAAVAMRRWRG